MYPDPTSTELANSDESSRVLQKQNPLILTPLHYHLLTSPDSDLTYFNGDIKRNHHEPIASPFSLESCLHRQFR